MLETKNFGRKSLEEVQEVLDKLGLSLGMDVPDRPVGASPKETSCVTRSKQEAGADELPSRGIVQEPAGLAD